jgi:hypothetical protein
VGTGQVLPEQVNRPLCLLRLLHLLRRLLLLPLGVEVVVAAVDGMVGDWHSQEFGIANVEWTCVGVHLEGLHDPSLVLSEYSQRYLRQHSLRVP